MFFSERFFEKLREPPNPLDIVELLVGTEAKWAQKLAEAEAHVVSANSKAFDLGSSTILESHGLLKRYVEEKSKSLAQTAVQNNRRATALSKIGQGLSTNEAKLHSIDQAKALDLWRKKLIAELEDDVSFCISPANIKYKLL
jgi:hypothetical protein